jgi:hypothetical protein
VTGHCRCCSLWCCQDFVMMQHTEDSLELHHCQTEYCHIHCYSGSSMVHYITQHTTDKFSGHIKGTGMKNLF